MICAPQTGEEAPKPSRYRKTPEGETVKKSDLATVSSPNTPVRPVAATNYTNIQSRYCEPERDQPRT